MFNEKNLRKLNLFVAIFSILICFSSYLGFRWWDGTTILSISLPELNITALNPIKSLLFDIIGYDLSIVFGNILCINIVWYMYVVFPVWCWSFVRRCLQL